jgi:hypothetical protein
MVSVSGLWCPPLNSKIPPLYTHLRLLSSPPPLPLSADSGHPVRWTFLTSGAEFHVMDYVEGAVLPESQWQAPRHCFNSSQGSEGPNVTERVRQSVSWAVSEAAQEKLNRQVALSGKSEKWRLGDSGGGGGNADDVLGRQDEERPRPS